MTKRMIAAQLSVGALLLVLVALMESYTGWDTAAQRLWFDSATHEWVVSNELHARLTWFFYDGPKILLVVLGIACVAGVLGGARWNLPPECRRGCLLLLLSLAFVPMLLGGAKQFTNVYCPKQIEEFGGEYVHQGVLECRNPANEGRSPGRCFPAGHASGGFALMMLFFCFRSRRDRWAGLGAGLIAGWGMGFYQMLRGQHFLSHTLFTMIGAWMIILLVTWALRGFSLNKLVSINNFVLMFSPGCHGIDNSSCVNNALLSRTGSFPSREASSCHAFLDAVRYLVRGCSLSIGIYFFAELTELFPYWPWESPTLHLSLKGFLFRSRFGWERPDGFVPFFNPALCWRTCCSCLGSGTADGGTGRRFHPLFLSVHGGALV